MAAFEAIHHRAPLPNWVWASSAPPDPDYEHDWQYMFWPLPGEEGANSTGASYEDAVNWVIYQHARIPTHGGGGAAIYNLPAAASFDEILQQSFLDDGASYELTSGLSEFAVDQHLKTRDHHHHSRVSDDICVVCQDSLTLSRDEKIASLDCGHDFHAGCIKPWLMRNNSCPLCKATGIRLH